MIFGGLVDWLKPLTVGSEYTMDNFIYVLEKMTLGQIELLLPRLNDKTVVELANFPNEHHWLMDKINAEYNRRFTTRD